MEGGVAAGGPFSPDWLRQCGVNPDRCHGFGFAFGLERCAQVRLDLADVRALWQPPYVPARKP